MMSCALLARDGTTQIICTLTLIEVEISYLALSMLQPLRQDQLH